MWGALILSHPTPAGEARGPVVPGWPDSAGLGAETEDARGVLRCQRARAAPRAFPPPTHSAPCADPTPRTRGPASSAGASGARPRGRALEGRRTGSGVFTSLLHFLCSASWL